MKEIEVKIKNIQLDVQTRQTSIKRLQDQQFETRKNDEFAALGHEIKRYEADVTKLEDGELEQMEALETAKAKLKDAQAKLAATQVRSRRRLATTWRVSSVIGLIRASASSTPRISASGSRPKPLSARRSEMPSKNGSWSLGS